MRTRRWVTAVLFLATAIAAGGCETSSTTSAGGPTPVKCQVTVAAPAMLDAVGGNSSVAVTALPECAWTASTSASWISGLSPASGQGNGSVSFRAAANDGSSQREAMIVINDEQARVSQRAACRYTLTPPTQTIAMTGGPSTVTVTTTDAGCAWTATADAGWISLTAPASGTGGGVINFTVAPSQGGQRTGGITVAGERANVIQSVANCSIAIAPASQNLPAAGGTGTIDVQAQSVCDWAAASNAPWITVTSGSTGTGNGVVTFAAAANAGAARSGSISIANQTFTVSQAAGSTPPGSCTYSLSPANQNAPAAASTGTVTVTTTATCPWTASSNAVWLTITLGAAGTGNGSVGFNVAANTGAARAGTLTIGTQTFTVNQAAFAAPCAYSISPTSQGVDANANSTTISVTTTAGCAWTATSNAPWITVTSGASGNGPGSTGLSIAANTGGQRSGTATIAGETFTVFQSPFVAPCTYSIASTTPQPIPALGGPATVAVTTTSACTWTATSNNLPWLTITSGASGTGNGSVGLSIAANTGAQRTGTATIAGQTFTVNQAAFVAPCMYSIAPPSQNVAASASTTTVTVTTTAGCTWTATSGAPWITVTSGAAGTGNGSVGLSIAANTGVARNGTATIAGQTFTVNQAAFVAPCMYSIAPTTQNVPAMGGARTVTVTTTSGCAWTASSNAPWITITSGGSGTGNGTVGFTVAANGGGPRSGTLTIAGQTATVTQN